MNMLKHKMVLHMINPEPVTTDDDIKIIMIEPSDGPEPLSDIVNKLNSAISDFKKAGYTDIKVVENEDNNSLEIHAQKPIEKQTSINAMRKQYEVHATPTCCKFELPERIKWCESIKAIRQREHRQYWQKMENIKRYHNRINGTNYKGRKK